LSISAKRHPTVPPPPQIDGFVVQTYALYFAQTMLFGLVDMVVKKPPKGG
jgi:hypothetical protein